MSFVTFQSPTGRGSDWNLLGPDEHPQDRAGLSVPYIAGKRLKSGYISAADTMKIQFVNHSFRSPT